MRDSLLIIGTGALATLFAARLARVGVEVSMLGTWADALLVLNAHGARVNGYDSAAVHASANAKDFRGARLALVLVKSWQTGRAALQLEECLADDGLAVTLQNGLGNAEDLARILGESRVGQGITTMGATLLEPGLVQVGGEGQVLLEKCFQMESLKQMLLAAGIKTKIHEDIRSHIWGKLVINSAINPLTALLQVRNGDLLENQSARKLLGEIAAETAAIASTENMKLPFSNVQSTVENAARASGQNFSSMLQDVLRGTRTEVDAINGKIIEAAEQRQVPAPLNRAMHHLINALFERGKINFINMGSLKEA